MRSTQWQTVLAAQLLAGLATYVLVSNGIGSSRSSEEVETYAGGLTMLLILLGFGSQYRSGSGLVPSSWLIALPMLAPAFAWLAGPIEVGTNAARHLTSYHVLGLVIQAYVLFKQARRAEELPGTVTLAESRNKQRSSGAESEEDEK